MSTDSPALPGSSHRHRFDVLHSHMFGSNLWGTLVGAACRVPVVIAAGAHLVL